MPTLLLEIDLSGRHVLLVGLGKVGYRRFMMLQEAGALIRAVDPVGFDRIGSEAGILPGELLREFYEVSHLTDVEMVFAAAPSEVNQRVVEDAKRLNLWVNSASDPQAGNLRIPAIWREGEFQLGVTTGGASPGLAARARTHAAGILGPAYGALAKVLADLRPLVQARIEDPLTRARLFRGWSDAPWLHRVEHHGAEAVHRALIRELEGLEAGRQGLR